MVLNVSRMLSSILINSFLLIINVKDKRLFPLQICKYEVKKLFSGRTACHWGKSLKGHICTLSTPKLFLVRQNNSSPKNENTVINYVDSCRSKTIRLSFIMELPCLRPRKAVRTLLKYPCDLSGGGNFMKICTLFVRKENLLVTS